MQHMRYSKFYIFQYGGRRHLGFSKKIEVLTVGRLWGPMCVILPNFVEIGQTVAEIGSLNGGSSPSWSCLPRT